MSCGRCGGKIGKYGSISGMFVNGGGKEPRCSCSLMGAKGGDVSRSLNNVFGEVGGVKKAISFCFGC